MFDDCRQWNRENIKNYIEVYLKIDLSELKKRDKKGIYHSSETHSVGQSLPYEAPKNPDILIDCVQSPKDIANTIMHKVSICKNISHESSI